MRIELLEGMYQQYNSINIFKTRDYVKIGAESYIDGMLQKLTVGMLPEDRRVIPIKPL